MSHSMFALFSLDQLKATYSFSFEMVYEPSHVKGACQDDITTKAS